jgi:hypothetical protein
MKNKLLSFNEKNIDENWVFISPHTIRGFYNVR